MGKSTSVSVLITALRAAGEKVGVLAVDPSSPFSGGALLGDRVRMQDHALDDGVFIRSMATRGHLGGIAWATSVGLLSYLLGPAAYKIAAVFGLGGLVLVAVAIALIFAWRHVKRAGR